MNSLTFWEIHLHPHVCNEAGGKPVAWLYVVPNIWKSIAMSVLEPLTI